MGGVGEKTASWSAVGDERCMGVALAASAAVGKGVTTLVGVELAGSVVDGVDSAAPDEQLAMSNPSAIQVIILRRYISFEVEISMVIRQLDCVSWSAQGGAVLHQ